MQRIASLILAASLAVAADKPNLSGIWVMDAAKSDFGGSPAPDSFKRTIEQNEPSLIMTDEQVGQAGPEKAIRKYTTDGKETTYHWMGNEVTSAAHWEGDTLVIVGKVDSNGTPVVVTSRLTLSADGKTLTENDKIVAAGNDVGAFKLVLVKR